MTVNKATINPRTRKQKVKLRTLIYNAMEAKMKYIITDEDEKNIDEDENS